MLEGKLLRLLRLQGFYGGYCDLFNFCVVAISSQSKKNQIYLVEFPLCSQSKTKPNYGSKF